MRAIREEVGASTWDTWPVGAKIAIERLEAALLAIEQEAARSIAGEYFEDRLQCIERLAAGGAS